VKLEFGAVAERLEAQNLQLFQFKQRVLLGRATTTVIPSEVEGPAVLPWTRSRFTNSIPRPFVPRAVPAEKWGTHKSELL